MHGVAAKRRRLKGDRWTTRMPTPAASHIPGMNERTNWRKEFAKVSKYPGSRAYEALTLVLSIPVFTGSFDNSPPCTRPVSPYPVHVYPFRAEPPFASAFAHPPHSHILAPPAFQNTQNTQSQLAAANDNDTATPGRRVPASFIALRAADCADAEDGAGGMLVRSQIPDARCLIHNARRDAISPRFALRWDWYAGMR